MVYISTTEKKDRSEFYNAATCAETSETRPRWEMEKEKEKKRKIKKTKPKQKTLITGCVTISTRYIWYGDFQQFFVSPTEFPNTCMKTSLQGQNQRDNKKSIWHPQVL